MHLAIQIISLFVLVMTGTLAGIMLGVAMEQETAQKLQAGCWIVRQNLNDQLFRKLMPPAFVLIVVSAISATVLFRGTSRLWMAGSSIGSVLVVLITIVSEVPLNDRMSKWLPDTLPLDWAETRNAWLKHHWRRTVCGLVAFVCAAIANSTTAWR